MDTITSNPVEPTPFLRQRPVRLTIYAGRGVFVRVMVGMSKEQVLQAWGGPQTINTTFTKDGIRREEWIFEDWENTSVVRHRYLYFEEGTLVGGWFQGSGQRLPAQAPSNQDKPKSQS